MSKQRIEDVLTRDGVYVSPTVGVSMRPMLRQGKDRVILVPPNGRLKRYDVPLYRRGKDYVLHRIIAVRPEDYVVLGDNCIAREYVRDEQIVGVLAGFYRNRRYVDLRDPLPGIVARHLAGTICDCPVARRGTADFPPRLAVKNTIRYALRRGIREGYGHEDEKRLCGADGSGSLAVGLRGRQ